MTAAFSETLKIGVIGPLTGGGAPWGNAAAEAVRILASETNAKGGIVVGSKKYRIEVIAYDDQYKAAEAVAAYNRLLNQDGVKYIMIATSAPTMALKKNVEDDKVIALTSSYSPAAIDRYSVVLCMPRISAVSGTVSSAGVPSVGIDGTVPLRVVTVIRLGFVGTTCT